MADKEIRNAPTEKMLLAAQQAAARHGVDLPKDFDKDFDVCKGFLDAYLAKPTPKALDFAQKISATKGVAIPESAITNSRELSAWIDANK